MRTFWKWAVVLTVPVIWVAVAWSQETFHPEGTTVKLLLLRQKSVQKELGISAGVAENVMAFTEKQSDAFGKVLGMAKDKRKEAIARLGKQNKKFLADTLNAKQTTRLNQLYLQFTAPSQLTKAETAKELKLTKDQQQKLKALNKEYRKEMGDILFGKDTEGRAQKFTELREKTRTTILSILTEKQQAQARKAVGPPFMGEIVFEDDSPTKK
jgi:hypothetical protein